MTTLHIQLRDGVAFTRELPSDDECKALAELWEHALIKGSPLMAVPGTDDQGHRIIVAVPTADIAMMRWIEDDDPLLLRERIRARLGLDPDTEIPDGALDPDQRTLDDFMEEIE